MGHPPGVGVQKRRKQMSPSLGSWLVTPPCASAYQKQNRNFRWWQWNHERHETKINRRPTANIRRPMTGKGSGNRSEKDDCTSTKNSTFNMIKPERNYDPEISPNDRIVFPRSVNHYCYFPVTIVINELWKISTRNASWKLLQWQGWRRYKLMIGDLLFDVDFVKSYPPAVVILFLTRSEWLVGKWKILNKSRVPSILGKKVLLSRQQSLKFSLHLVAMYNNNIRQIVPLFSVSKPLGLPNEQLVKD